MAVTDTFCADRILPRLKKKPNSCNSTSVLYSGLYHHYGRTYNNSLCSLLGFSDSELNLSDQQVYVFM